MMDAPTLLTPPAQRPVGLEEAKEFLRVDYDEEDALIDGLIEAAVAYLDGWSGILGRCLIDQQWTLRPDYWSASVHLPFPDVSAVSVSYLDPDGVRLAAPTPDISHDRSGWFAAWPAGTFWPVTAANPALIVTFTAGYGPAANSVPAALRLAMKLLINHWYNSREAVGASLDEVPLAFSALAAPHRALRL